MFWFLKIRKTPSLLIYLDQWCAGGANKKSGTGYKKNKSALGL